MRKNQNSSFYHYCSILYGEDMEEEIEKNYFMTLKEMANYYNVHPSSLGKVIRYKKCLKKIPNTIFKRVYEPVFLKVCNEVKKPKVDIFLEEIDTKPYEEKKNQSFKFFEEEEEDKQIENQQEVKVSMLNGDTTTTTLIDNEFDNQMIINMNMKSQKPKKSQNLSNNVNIKLVNDIDNLFIQSQSIEQDNHIDNTMYQKQENNLEDNSKQIEINSKNKPQNINNDVNIELQSQTQSNSIEEKHTKEPNNNPKQIEINSKQKPKNRNNDLNVELQSQSQSIEKTQQKTNENSIQLKEEQNNYSMISDILFSNDLTDIDDTLDILSKKENRSKINSNTQNEFSSYFFNDDIETIIDEKKIEQKQDKSELDIFFEECDITNKIDINDLSTDELDELDKSNLEEFIPTFF